MTSQLRMDTSIDYCIDNDIVYVSSGMPTPRNMNPLSGFYAGYLSWLLREHGATVTNNEITFTSNAAEVAFILKYA